MTKHHKRAAQELIDETPTQELGLRRNAFRQLAGVSAIFSVLSGKIAYELFTAPDPNIGSELLGGLAVAASAVLAANVPNALYHSHLVTQAIQERSQQDSLTQEA